MQSRNSRVLPFNVQAVNKATARDGKTTEYAIKGERGLWLSVTPRGTGTFIFRYDAPAGKVRSQRKKKIGRRDALKLADARRIADDMRRDVERGIDVAKIAQARREAMTFRDLADRCHNENTAIKDSTRKVYRDALLADVFDEIGNKPAQEVTADDIAAIARTIAERGSKVQADRTKAAIAGMYKWGRAQRLVTNTPTAGLVRHGPKVARDRVLSSDELKTFWKAMHKEDAPASTAVRRIIKLAIFTGQRRSEVAGARLDELSLDGDEPTWTLAGDKNVRGKLIRGRTKSGREQVVHLSKQAVAIFNDALVEFDKSDKPTYVFPAEHGPASGKKAPRTLHIHGESISKAMRRLRQAIVDAAEMKGEKSSVGDITVHDLRRTMATYLGNQGVHPVVLEMILGHAGEGVTRKHYNHAMMTEQVRQAMQLWADNVIDTTTDKEDEQT
jgi:integrase